MTDYRPQNVTNQLLTVVKIFLTDFSRHGSLYKRKKWLIRKLDYLALIINVLNTLIDAVIQVLFQEINWPLARIFVSAVTNVAILIYLLTLHCSLRNISLLIHSLKNYLYSVHYLSRLRYKKMPNSKTNNTNKSKIGTKMATKLFESSSPCRFSFSGSDRSGVVDDNLGTCVVTMGIFELWSLVFGLWGIPDTLLVVADLVVDAGDDVVDDVEDATEVDEATVGRSETVDEVAVKTGWDVTWKTRKTFSVHFIRSLDRLQWLYDFTKICLRSVVGMNWKVREWIQK